jgi:Fe-S-cluster-containing dehydrogenase component
MGQSEESKLSRRNFLKLVGGTAIGIGVMGYGFPRVIGSEGLAVIPLSKGYLLVDSKKCAGCLTCMLACSLTHEGKENLSLSRIQIIQDPFGKFPNDLAQSQCRQCEKPACVEDCPTGACHVDKTQGNVRRVDQKKCLGAECLACVEACPFEPSRALFDFEDGFAQKCDLCAQTPFWNEKGGPGGKQACVEVCPVKAIRYTEKMPVQEGDEGYDINMRNKNWEKLGFPIV